MPSTVEELDGVAKIAIEVPAEDLKPHLDKAYAAIAEQVNIPGFRKGKVPQALIDQRFGAAAVLNEALNDIIGASLGQAIEEHGLAIIGQPEIDEIDAENWKRGEALKYVASVTKRPEFDLPDFSKVTIEVDPIDEKSLDVEGRVDMLRQRFATTKDVERKAKEGDVVTVDLEGSRDGESLAEATAQGVTFTIGKDTMLDGLDEAVTGLKAGESADFRSELVGGPLQGETVDIKVTVSKVQEQELPELDDEFAQMVSQFDTVEEMKADLTEGAKKMAQIDQAVAARDKALEAIVAETKIDLPASFVQGEIDARHEEVNSQLGQMGMSLEQYLKNTSDERTAEDFWKELDERTSTALKAQMILDRLVEETKPKIEQSDLTSYLMQRAQMNGTSPEQEMQHMFEHNHMQEWMVEIQRNKALTIITEQVDAKDTDGNKVDMSVLRPATPEVVDPEVEDDEDEVMPDVEGVSEPMAEDK